MSVLPIVVAFLVVWSMILWTRNLSQLKRGEIVRGIAIPFFGGIIVVLLLYVLHIGANFVLADATVLLLTYVGAVAAIYVAHLLFRRRMAFKS